LNSRERPWQQWLELKFKEKETRVVAIEFKKRETRASIVVARAQGERGD
jgi:hypothetical protein